MSEVRDFDAGREDRTPHPFKLGGQTFLAKPSLSWPSMVRLMDELDATKTSHETTLTVNHFFDVVLMKADRERFRALVNDEDSDYPVEMDQVMAVVGWLMDTYTGKAPGQSASSESGLPSTPDSLTEPSSLQATGTDSTDSPLRVVRL